MRRSLSLSVAQIGIVIGALSWQRAASACCGSAVVGEQLGAGESLAVASRSSLRARVGTFDREGAFSTSSEGSVDWDVGQSVLVAISPHARLELGASTEFGVGLRRARGVPLESGFGWGDSLAWMTARVVTPDDGRYAPWVRVRAAATLPTGRATSELPLRADARGDGRGAVHFSTDVQTSFLTFGWARGEFESSFFVGGPSESENPTRLRTSVAVGLVADAFALFGQGSFTAEVAPSRFRETRVGIGGSVEVERDVTLTANASAPVLVDGAARAGLAYVRSELGLRWSPR